MKDFRSLKVWEKSHSLALEVYRSSKSFPKDEMFSLTIQLRRAATSIPANIAEGCGRGSEAEFSRFLQIAMGSASELEYHILLARDLGYLDPPMYESLNDHIVEIKKMLATLIRTISK